MSVKKGIFEIPVTVKVEYELTGLDVTELQATVTSVVQEKFSLHNQTHIKVTGDRRPGSIHQDAVSETRNVVVHGASNIGKAIILTQ
jgi:hypothetical protein